MCILCLTLLKVCPCLLHLWACIWTVQGGAWCRAITPMLKLSYSPIEGDNVPLYPVLLGSYREGVTRRYSRGTLAEEHLCSSTALTHVTTPSDKTTCMWIWCKCYVWFCLCSVKLLMLTQVYHVFFNLNVSLCVGVCARVCACVCEYQIKPTTSSRETYLR